MEKGVTVITSNARDLQIHAACPFTNNGLQLSLQYISDLPKMPVVPSGEDLRIKATTSGITYLKEGKFRSRYTGNKFSKVDIQGHLWLRAADMKQGLPGKKKRKAPVETGAVIKDFNAMEPGTISENFSTLQPELLTNGPELSTKKSYRVNKREVRQRILGFINTQAGAKELYFWTVTFPAGTTDAKAYQIYNSWLTSLRKYRLLKNYIWVAERQENGTVHFHIAIPHKMPVQRANAMMRGTLKTFARRGEIPFSVYQCAKYNGVDIAKNRKTKRVTNFAIKKGSRSLVTYLTKYVTKNDTDFEHLAWHNSRGYSSIFTGVTFTVPEFRANGMYSRMDVSKKFEGEFFIFIPWYGEPPDKLVKHLFTINSFIQSQLN